MGRNAVQNSCSEMIHTLRRMRAYSSNSSKLNSYDGGSLYKFTVWFIDELAESFFVSLLMGRPTTFMVRQFYSRKYEVYASL